MRRPIVGVAVHWILGMAVAANGDRIGACIAIAVVACFWTAAGFIPADVEKKKRIQSMALYTAVFTLGVYWYMWVDEHNVSRLSTIQGAVEEADVTVRGAIVDVPDIDGDRAAMTVEIEQAQFGGSGSVRLKERLKVYVRFDSQEEKEQGQKWKRGSDIQARGILRAPLPATNFGAFDYADYLHRQKIHWTLHVKGLSDIKADSKKRWSLPYFLSYVDEFRRLLSERIDKLYSDPYAGFMNGLVIGVRDGLDPEQFRQFSQIGMTHILAISGLHVAIYVGALLWLLRRTPLTRETQLTVVMIAVPFYVIITGASPSVVRAGIMAILGLYAARRHLLKDGLHLLCFAATAMLAWNPYYLHDVGFQLSFAVTAGLIAGVPFMNAILPIPHKGLRSAVSVTVVAQAVSFPLTLFYFNGVSLFSLPANFVMVPLFSFIVLPLGTVSLLFSFVSLYPASMAAWCAERVSEAGFWAVERMNSLDEAYSIWASPPLWWIAVYYAFGFWILAFLSGHSFGIRLRIAPGIAAAAALTLFAVSLVYAYSPDMFDRRGTVSFIDVGQGDSILIRAPYGKTMLIDGGGTLSFWKPGEEWRKRNEPYEVGRKLLVPLLKKRGVQRIDALFLSHGDTDHIGGLQAVIEEIPVERIWFNGTLPNSEVSETLFQTALTKSIPLSPAYAGDTIPIDAVTQIRMLHPQPPVNKEAVRFLEDQNESSLVFELAMYGSTLLFTGDIEDDAERSIVTQLMESGVDNNIARQVDVLKIAHHGSKTSSTAEWLQFWNPKASVISAGRNNIYRHPHPSVTQRLYELGIPHFRTDRHGEVQFLVTKRNLKARTKLSEYKVMIGK